VKPSQRTVAVLTASAAAVALIACTPSTPNAGTDATGATPASLCSYEPFGDPARAVDPPSRNDVRTTGEVAYTITTSQGPVTVTMDRAAAPCTVHSFEALVKQDFFDDTQCHRLVDSGIFVLQCGDPTGTGRGGPGYRFDDELSGTSGYPAGTVAMANAGPDTNGSQFFLVYAASELPPDYTVFGRMDEASRGVVARIAVEGQDGSNPDGTGRPNNEARIIDVTTR
jgi:peptidyl-prolyl cis-trans isomerase B (cyclophilin B)